MDNGEENVHVQAGCCLHVALRRWVGPRSLISYFHTGLIGICLARNCSRCSKVFQDRRRAVDASFTRWTGPNPSSTLSVSTSACCNAVFSLSLCCSDWEIVWDTMSKECHEEITLVEGDGLLDTIETYLRKHKYDRREKLLALSNRCLPALSTRFCSECKLKVIEAYDILMDTPECKHRDRKGFCPALYEGKIRRSRYTPCLRMIPF